MRISRRIHIYSDDPLWRELERIGATFEGATTLPPLVRRVPTQAATVWIDETDPIWPRVEATIARLRANDSLLASLSPEDRVATIAVPSTEFTEAERSAAEWLALSSVWQAGYPQPMDDWPAEETYDLTDYCPRCGTGKRQIGPFRLHHEPKWGRRWLMALHWEPGALFVRREVFEAVFAPHGVSGREVLLHRSGNPLMNAVQLAPEVEVSLRTGDEPPAICPACGRLKRRPTQHGFSPPPLDPPDADLVVSRDWIGHGAQAAHQVLVSGRLYQALRGLEGRTCAWHPCGEPTT